MSAELHRPESHLPMRPLIFQAAFNKPDHYITQVSAAYSLCDEFEVRVYGLDCVPEPMDWPDGVEVITMRTIPDDDQPENWPSPLKSLLTFAQYCQWIAREIKVRRPALVYAYENHAFLACLAPCRRYEIPLILHRHELETEPPKLNFSFGQQIAYAAGKLARFADALVFPEPGRAAIYCERIRYRGTPFMVPNFPHVIPFPEPDWDACLAARAARPSVMFRGSIHRAASVLEAIDAIAELDGVRLDLFGHHYQDHLEECDKRARDRGVGDRVEYRGRPSYQQANAETRKASVGLAMVLPETTGTKNLALASGKIWEYAACGLPIIVPDVPHYRDLLNDECWVFYAPFGDAGAIAEQVRDILHDPERYERIARAARLAFERRYNYDAVMGPLTQKIRTLIGTCAQAPAEPKVASGSQNNASPEL